ncbi:MAG: aromatic hydrocarbon degradation membrane protein [Bacteroidetes bacterium OLB12]|nr:MAG: aromatic hydrocarbon degradation membrane protein [Bacteroidetes bacterium OLB12]
MKLMSNVLAGIAMLLPTLVQAQSFSESALLFSRIKPAGSARIMGMGGVQTSLGGDYSSAQSNPAGLGMFNRSEFTISPGFFSAVTDSKFLGNTTTDSKTNLHVPGFSLVFQTEKDGRMGFLSGTFAISYNRINNFNENFSYEGDNTTNSIIDYFIEDAYGYSDSEFNTNGALHNTVTWLGYQNYLIEEDDGYPGEYFSVIGGFPYQSETVQYRGNQGQWNLSYGANLSDKVFLGAGLGLTTLRFSSKKTFRETFEGEPLNTIRLEEELNIRGSGINATLGVIGRPLDFIQLGVSYTTPTLYSITDVYSAFMATNWNNFDYYGDGSKILSSVSDQTDEFISEYSLRTPGRLSAGAAIFINNKGFVSADVDLVNYAGARYSSGLSGISFSSDNNTIKESYQTTANFRLGGEFRWDKLRFRAGGSYMPDPFRTEQNNSSRQITSITGGVGYRTKKFYADFALVFSKGANTYRPYRVNSATSPLVTMDNQTSFGMITVGFPF